MKYYYLEGIDKLGPYSLDEIKSRDLSPDTMVLREDKVKWTPLSDLDEFKEVENIYDGTDRDQEEVIKSNQDEKIRLPSYTRLIVFIVLSIALSAIITHFQKKNDYKKFNEEISKVFKGRATVCDYFLNEGNNGTLHKVSEIKDKKGGLTLEDLQNSRFPGIVAGDLRLFTYRDTYDNSNKKYLKTYKSLVEYYEAPNNYSGDGFIIYEAEKDGDNIFITEYFSGDMAYKVPDKKYIPGYEYSDYETKIGYSSSGFPMTSYEEVKKHTAGKWISNNRPSINKCYEDAAKFLTVKNEDNFYSSNSWFDISNLKYRKTDFYHLEQYGWKYYRSSSETIKVVTQAGNKQTSLIDSEKISSLTSRGDANVYNSQWIVWYKKFTNQYSIQETKWMFLKYWSIYSVIGIFLSFMLYHFLKYRKRIVISK